MRLPSRLVIVPTIESVTLGLVGTTLGFTIGGTGFARATTRFGGGGRLLGENNGRAMIASNSLRCRSANGLVSLGGCADPELAIGLVEASGSVPFVTAGFADRVMVFI